jgi:hypothetical protein
VTSDTRKLARLGGPASGSSSGQRCTAVERILVDEAVADRFVELVVVPLGCAIQALVASLP